MSVRVWIHGLAAAGIGGLASALSAALAVPESVNLSHDGLVNMAKIAFFGAIMPVLCYLKQSPLPSSQDCK